MTERELSDAMPALLRPGGLYDQAEAVLRRKLAADPHDTAALWKLAEIQRQRGDFAAARDGYRRLRVLGPDRRKAAWLHAVLSGDGVPEAAPPRRIWPVPFVWMRNFLAPMQCERLSILATEGSARFAPARTGKKGATNVDPEARITLESDHRTLQAFRPWFIPKIRSVVPEVLERLRMEDIGRYGIRMDMRVYLTGGFYRAHTDGQYDPDHPRKLSFVYFFHREPRRFSGGDLLLYDTDANTADRSFAAFSRIVPLRNSIVFFPSVSWHQVPHVQCETNDFQDGRWAVNGHLWQRDGDAAADRRAGV